MSYRLGVDVGGTFTDVLLVEEGSGSTWRAKTASTPADQAVGVLNGIGQVCAAAGIELSEVAAGAARHDRRDQRDPRGQGRHRRPGHHQGLPAGAADRPLLRARRPGRLDHLAQARAAGRRWRTPSRSTSGSPATARSIRALDDDDVRAQLAKLAGRGIQALAVSLINSFADPAHEKRIAEIAAEVLPGVPVSLSSDVLPELREYERTLTTVANGYVQPQVKRYVADAVGQARARAASPASWPSCAATAACSRPRRAVDAPVTMLLSGPAGGVTGAVWVAEQCGYRDLITFDMGGTSTDVGAGAGPQPADRPGDQGRRPHRARLQRRRPHGRRRRRLDRARARADQGAAGRPAVRRRRPGPGRLRQGRHRADGHRRQRRPRLPAARRWPAARSPWTSRRRGPPSARSPRPWAWSPPEAAAAGIVDIVNENMLGGAAAGLGAAGLRPARLRARRVRRRRPAARQRAGQADRGVAGDRAAVTRRALRARRRHHQPPRRVGPHRAAPVRRARRRRARPDAARARRRGRRQRLAEQGAAARPADGRLPGRRPLPRPGLRDPGRRRRPRRRPWRLAACGERFDAEHDRLFSFLLDVDHELVNARATVTGPRPDVAPVTLRGRRRRPVAAPVARRTRSTSGASTWTPASTTARSCGPATWSRGPAIVTEMDSTTLVLPGHAATVHAVGLPADQPRPRGLSHGTDHRDRDRHRSRRRRRRPGHPRPHRERRCATPATRWTRCCSAPRCRRASASSTTSSR